jgi:hypothetical protein
LLKLVDPDDDERQCLTLTPETEHWVEKNPAQMMGRKDMWLRGH